MQSNVSLRLYSEYKWYPDFNTVNSCAHKCLATSDSHIYVAIVDGGKCECGNTAPPNNKYVQVHIEAHLLNL